MAVTMALILSIASLSFAKEDSHGAWDLADEIKKAQILISLNNFFTSLQLSLLTIGD